jgi:hypothetical protein
MLETSLRYWNPKNFDPTEHRKFDQKWTQIFDDMDQEMMRYGGSTVNQEGEFRNFNADGSSAGNPDGFNGGNPNGNNPNGDPNSSDSPEHDPYRYTDLHKSRTKPHVGEYDSETAKQGWTGGTGNEPRKYGETEGSTHNKWGHRYAGAGVTGTAVPDDPSGLYSREDYPNTGEYRPEAELAGKNAQVFPEGFDGELPSPPPHPPSAPKEEINNQGAGSPLMRKKMKAKEAKL